MIVMLHGFGGTHRHWDCVRGERYLAPDIRGHGEAGSARPVSVAACIEDIAALAPPRFDLCGYSMGGRLALHVALALPQRVRRLVLISTSAGIEDPAERAARARSDEQLARRIESAPIERFAAEWAELELFAGDPPRVREAAAADARRCTPAGLAAALRGLGPGTVTSVWDRLGELTMPLLVLAGERDPKYLALGRRIAAAVPAGDFVAVPGAGHRLALEAADFVRAQLDE